MTVARPADHADAHLISHSFMQVKFPLIIVSSEAALAHLFDRMKQLKTLVEPTADVGLSPRKRCRLRGMHQHAATRTRRCITGSPDSDEPELELAAPTPGESPSTTLSAFTRELERSLACDRIRLPAS